MISGTVNLHREPIIQLAILDLSGKSRVFEAVVDTGFNGSLTLPIEVITELGLAFSGRGSATLANGEEVECDIYAAAVIWDGERRNVLVEAADTDPLVGMRLMYGYRIIIEDIDGGLVSLEQM